MTTHAVDCLYRNRKRKCKLHILYQQTYRKIKAQRTREFSINATSMAIRLVHKNIFFEFPKMVWSGLVWSGLVWSGLVWSGAKAPQGAHFKSHGHVPLAYQNGGIWHLCSPGHMQGPVGSSHPHPHPPQGAKAPQGANFKSHGHVPLAYQNGSI